MIKEYPNIDFNIIKKEAMKAAKELGYGKTVVQAIKKATGLQEVNKIMITARHML